MCHPYIESATALSDTYVQITGVYGVLQEPPSLGWGRNSGAQAVLSTPVLITFDDLGSRLGNLQKGIVWLYFTVCTIDITT